MERPTTTPSTKAPTYWECPTCGYLSSDPSLADARVKCPQCKCVDGPRRPFPPDRQRLLDKRIRAYYGEGEWQITVILASAMLEALLEDILDRIMASHGADVAIRGAMLDALRAVGQRLSRLFPDLTGSEFEEAAAEAGFRDFPKRWRNLRHLRNAFIHDTPYRDVEGVLDKSTATEAMVLLDQAYKLFVTINNRFVVASRKKSCDDGLLPIHGDDGTGNDAAVPHGHGGAEES